MNTNKFVFIIRYNKSCNDIINTVNYITFKELINFTGLWLVNLEVLEWEVLGCGVDEWKRDIGESLVFSILLKG